MVKLIAVAMFRQAADGSAAAAPVALGMAADLSGFGYFQRASVREMISFLARTIVQRTSAGSRQTVRQDDYYCHVVCHAGDGANGGGGLAGVAVTDRDYPATAAFCVVAKAIEELEAAAAGGGAGGSAGMAAADAGPPFDWRACGPEDNDGALPILEGCLLRYQDPAAADKLTKIQRDLDETKVILHQTIDSVLRRGEKLDALVDKSADLSLASQLFYKQARRTNSCCKMM
jgi:synaptobrevin homolog YKT6